MSRMATTILILALSACSLVRATDRYGNHYGGWYNHGDQYAWQLELCEKRIEDGAVPSAGRPLAMRCCMRDHGVPVEDAAGCG